MNNIFKKIFKGKILLVGIGNILRADDGFGSLFVQNIRDKLTRISSIDAGISPENYVGKIKSEKPDTILFIDAVSMNLPAGDYRILTAEEILEAGFTTHDISIALFIKYLKEQVSADTYFLGIQPQDISLGKEITPVLRQKLTEIQSLMLEADICTNPI